MSIAAEFKNQGLVRGSTLLLAAKEGLAMIERARDSGVRVLGIEGFHVKDETIRPDMSEILDLGSAGDTSWDEASAFLQKREDSRLMFEITTDEDTGDLLLGPRSPDWHHAD